MLRLALIAAAVLIATWALLVVLARRLPEGAAKDLATVLPACATTARRLRRDPRVPRRARVAVVIALLWVLSPIDLIPEFLPIIGQIVWWVKVQGALNRYWESKAGTAPVEPAPVAA